jgi:hypothetical protein
VEHPCLGRRLVIGALSCLALFLSGCGTSASDIGGAASPTKTARDTRPSAPEMGEIGTWELLNSSITSDSTVLQLGVTRLGCASGVTGAVLDPVVQVKRERIVIRTDVEALSPGGYTCQGNNSVPVTVELDEPVGKRELVDAACLEGRAVNTAACMDKGVRWRP